MINDRSAIIQNERDWHEQEAHRRYALDRLLYAPPAFDEVVKYAFDFLDGRAGELTLDAGCGEGKETLRLAARGLRVASMDLSHRQLDRARQKIEVYAPEADVFFVQANAEEPPFANGSFRIIYGKAILHHLDPELSRKEINRLLKPGGRASFAEPLARHPFFWLGRRLTPRLRTVDEHPMLLHELVTFGEAFRFFEVKTFLLLTPMAFFFRLFPGGEWLFQKVYALLSRVDEFLFSRFRQFQRAAWYGIVNVEK